MGKPRDHLHYRLTPPPSRRASSNTGWYHRLVGDEEPRKRHETYPALTYLERLDKETMTLAWGPDKSLQDHRRIILTATVFSRKFQERMCDRPPESLEENKLQHFLMSLMNDVISECAEHEGLDAEEGHGLIGDVTTRDHVLEFNEVLEEYADNPQKSLDEHLKTAVENRPEKAAWSWHWSSG